MIAGLTVRAEYYNAPLHKCYKWPNLEELGVQVAETPLIPTIAKSVMKKLPKKLESLVLPLISAHASPTPGHLISSAELLA